jgi:hypothetical protein
VIGQLIPSFPPNPAVSRTRDSEDDVHWQYCAVRWKITCLLAFRRRDLIGHLNLGPRFPASSALGVLGTRKGANDAARDVQGLGGGRHEVVLGRGVRSCETRAKHEAR